MLEETALEADHQASTFGTVDNSPAHLVGGGFNQQHRSCSKGLTHEEDQSTHQYLSMEIILRTKLATACQEVLHLLDVPLVQMHGQSHGSARLKRHYITNGNLEAAINS